MSNTVRVLLVHDDRRLEIETACEPINEWLCITPVIGRHTEGGPLVLGGGFAVTHIPTGYSATSGQACINCVRYAGEVLAKLDWPTVPELVDPEAFKAWLNGHPEPLRREVAAVRELWFICDGELCEPRHAEIDSTEVAS